MAWQLTGSVEEFLTAAGDFLIAERARNTVPLTVAETVRLRPSTYQAPLFGWWRPDGGPVSGAFLHTPPHPVLLATMPPEAAAALAGELTGRGIQGINGESDVVAAFTRAWPAAAREFRRMRLFRLGKLAWPDPMPAGSARLASAEDKDLLISWFEAFSADTGDIGSDDHEAAVLNQLSYQGITLWETGGRAVSLAATTRMVAGMTRVGPVYTPPELRGRGYAGAATAAVSQAALDAGAAEVLLYTDLANPTSNALYQRLGYRPVEDRVVFTFG
jgi:GNAT superfamily N-acetyltransferase